MTTTYRRGDVVRHRDTDDRGIVIAGLDALSLIVVGWNDGTTETLPAVDVYAEPTDELVNSVTASYVTCALWSSIDEDGEPLDSSHDADDLADETLAQMRADVSDFLALVAAEGIVWEDGWSPEQFGHDLWLTRNHHGAGFWDRYYGATDPRADVGRQLTKWAHAAGSSDLYVGDDGALYV